MTKSTISARIRFGRGLYLLFAIIYLLFIIGQVFTAGLAIFVGAENWLTHTSLVHILGLNIPVLMLIVAFIGKMPRWGYGYVIGLALFVFGMYFSANFTRIASWVGALHPVLAMILFILSVSVVVDTWKLIRKK
ncbi:DUF6220 domain-containing protein [Bacillus nitroreducens]